MLTVTTDSDYNSRHPTPSLRKWLPLAEGCFIYALTASGGVRRSIWAHKNTYRGARGSSTQTPPSLTVGTGETHNMFIECVAHNVACVVNAGDKAWFNIGLTSMKPFDSDEEGAEQLGAYQKELRRKLNAEWEAKCANG